MNCLPPLHVHLGDNFDWVVQWWLAQYTFHDTDIAGVIDVIYEGLRMLTSIVIHTSEQTCVRYRLPHGMINITMHPDR